MGQLVLGAAGAVAGTFLGVGPGIGWTVGSMLGGVLFSSPDKVQRVQGPTLSDGRVFSAEYGTATIWGLGTFQNAGIFAWNTDKIGTLTTTTQSQEGGKGGGGGTETITETTTYHIDCLIVVNDTISDGVGRGWDNGKLVYNLLEGAGVSTILATTESPLWDRMTFYSGWSGQLPDPDYEAAVGVGFAPAYRHRATIFIKGLKLGQAPAPIRNIAWEVIEIGTFSSAAEVSLYDGGAITVTAFVVHGRSSEIVWYTTSGLARFIAVRPLTAEVLADVTVTGTKIGYPLWVDDDGNLHGWSFGGGFGNLTKTQINLDGTSSTTAYTGNSMLPSFVSSGIPVAALDNNGKAWLAADSSGAIIVLDTDANTSTRLTPSPFTSIKPMWRGGAVPGRMYCYSTSSSGTRGWGYYDIYSGVFTTLNLITSSSYSIALVSDAGFIYVNRPGSFTLLDKFTSEGALAGTATLTGSSADFDGMILDDLGYLYVDGLVSSTNTWWRVNTSDMTVETLTVPTPNHPMIGGNAIAGLGAMGFDPTTNNFEIFAFFAASLITPSYRTYQSATQMVLERSGYTNGTDFDVSQLSTISRPMRSLPVSQVGPGRAPLDLLSSTGFFDVYCSDKIYAVPRGGASVVTIPFEDLGTGRPGEDVEPLEWRIVNDMEAPAFRSLTYRNLANDYQVDMKSSDRLTSTLANTVRNDQTPMGFFPAEAKEVVDVWANDMVNSTLSSTISVLGDYAYLEPTNIITVTDREGSLFRSRITKVEDSYPVIKLDITVEGVSITSTPAITDEDYEESSVVSGQPLTDLLLLDIPALLDAHAASGAPYAAARGVSDVVPWPGYTLYQSSNSVDYTPIAGQINGTVMGSCQTALGNWTGGRVFDEKSAVRVRLPTGLTLTAATNQTMLDSLLVNACLIGDELCQFRDSTAVGGSFNDWDLTGFLRGARGTEWAMTGHAAGDRFVLLESATMARPAMANSQLGLELQYKPITLGRLLSSTAAEPFTSNGVALETFSPVDARCERDGSNNATISFHRRSRLTVRMIGTLGISVPLGENLEEYEADIYSDGTFTTVVRTIETGAFALSGGTSTLVSFEYLAADQTLDGLTPGNPINVRIYMISTVVGRGYSLEATV